MFDSSTTTPRLGLPLLEAAQAQKHVTHNEALLLIDAAMHLAVISRRQATPPQIAEGMRYLVPQGATGGWASQAGKLALEQAGGWLFLAPRAGWRLWVEDEGKFLLFDGAAWIDPLPAPDVTASPRLGINTTADEVNRLSVASPATLFSHAGDDHRLKLNKNAAGDTVSLLYQTGWSGRAEMGLAGDDDFRIKVSADGAGWKDAIVVERATGRVSLPNTPPPQGAGGARILFNQALATQGPGFATETYIGGSAIAVPEGALQPGTRYRLVIGVTKTAAGTVPPVMRLRFGTTGTLDDAAVATVTFPAQTAASDEGRITLELTFLGAGASASVQVLASLTHLMNSSGLATGPGPVRRATSAPFNSAVPGAVLGVSLNAGTAAAWTIWLAQASLENLA